MADFNPLAPRGARHKAKIVRSMKKLFQSTRPSRGETCHGKTLMMEENHFNPLAPRGARPEPGILCGKGFSISIHSPLAGRDGERIVL